MDGRDKFGRRGGRCGRCRRRSNGSSRNRRVSIWDQGRYLWTDALPLVDPFIREAVERSNMSNGYRSIVSWLQARCIARQNCIPSLSRDCWERTPAERAPARHRPKEARIVAEVIMVERSRRERLRRVAERSEHLRDRFALASG